MSKIREMVEERGELKNRRKGDGRKYGEGERKRKVLKKRRLF